MFNLKSALRHSFKQANQQKQAAKRMFSSKTNQSKKLGWMAYAPLVIAPAFYFMKQSRQENQVSYAWGGPSKHQSQIDLIKKNKPNYPDNTLLQAFDESYFNSLTPDQQDRFMRQLSAGIAHPEVLMGVFCMSPTDYDEFRPFYKRACEIYHNVDLDKTKHRNDWDLSKVDGLPPGGVLDLTKLGLPPLSIRVRTGRNLRKYNLPGAMTK